MFCYFPPFIFFIFGVGAVYQIAELNLIKFAGTKDDRDNNEAEYPHRAGETGY